MTATAQPKTPKRASVAAVAGHVERRVRPVLDEYSKAALKAMRQARDFPANTCAGSRHAALIAEHLIRRGPLPMLNDKPRYCGESIAHTVAALWQARTEIERLRDLLTTQERGRFINAAVAAVRGSPAGCKTPFGCEERGCLGWCDEHRPDGAAACGDATPR